MRLLLLSLSLSVIAPAFAQQVSASEAKKKMDTKYGFRDVRFGTPVSAFTGLVLYKTLGDRKMYKRKNENLTLGSYKINNIVYTFYKSELSAVAYAIVGQINTEGVKQLVSTAYGPPQLVGGPEEWRSSKVHIQWLPLDKANAFLTVESIPLRDKREAVEASINKKAAADL